MRSRITFSACPAASIPLGAPISAILSAPPITCGSSPRKNWSKTPACRECACWRGCARSLKDIRRCQPCVGAASSWPLTCPIAPCATAFGAALSNWDCSCCAPANAPFGSGLSWMSKTTPSRRHWWSLRPNASGWRSDMPKKKPSPPAILKKLGLRAENDGVFDGQWFGSGPVLKSVSPINGKVLASVRTATDADYERIVERASAAFAAWKSVPAPKRGELIRQFGNALRAAKSDLGKLVTLEAGKILPEGEGEVQEMIDICDFAVGLSRQLYGLTMPSERPGHRMAEQWHPLGIIGIISAFNFPVAVWAWNSALAVVCGDATLWKPSEQTPLCAIATIKIAERVCRENGVDPALFSLAISERAPVGDAMAHDKRLPLVSATGSTKMGRDIGEKVQRRLGRALLELGGNNGILVAASADLELATRAILFGAVGTAGQRCTSTRRVFVHRSLEKELTKRLISAYRQVPIGNPLEAGTLMGPLISIAAVDAMQQALRRLREEGGEILFGGRPLTGEKFPGG